MNDKIIKKTQDSLGKVIKKPPLTEKLLNKPPFRFLHDITTSVIKTTGFMKGLFADSEMSSDNVKDKESKIAFLQKAIDIVSLVLGKSVSARPSKVVAGHEPEKTNEFLQLLAEAINKKVDNAEFVERVLKGDGKGSVKREKPPAGARDKREDSADRRRRKEKESDPEKGHRSKREDKEEKRDRGKSRDKDRDKDKDKDRDKDKDKDRDKHRDGSDRSKDRHSSKDRSRDREKDRHHRDRSHDKGEDRERRRRKESRTEESEPGEVSQPHRDAEEESVKKERRSERHRKEDEGEKEERVSKKTEETVMNGHLGEEEAAPPPPPPEQRGRSRMARPSSARPAPPRVKKSAPEPQDVHIVGQSNAPNVIVDKKGDDSDDDDFIAKEEEPLEPVEPPPPAEGDPGADEQGGEHGGLVKKILETKKELEGGSQMGKMGKKTEIERVGVVDATRRKEREMVQREIDKLRAAIQLLTRSANPLGKIMDFVQEDLDSMQKELETWSHENRENGVSLQREEHITQSAVEPLRAQLKELDSAIGDQLDLIAAVKANIIRNDDKIEKMLSNTTKS